MFTLGKYYLSIPVFAIVSQTRESNKHVKNCLLLRASRAENKPAMNPAIGAIYLSDEKYLLKKHKMNLYELFTKAKHTANLKLSIFDFLFLRFLIILLRFPILKMLLAISFKLKMFMNVFQNPIIVFSAQLWECWHFWVRESMKGGREFRRPRDSKVEILD